MDLGTLLTNVFCVVMFVNVSFGSDLTIKESTFEKGPLCSVATKISSNCMLESTSATRGRMDCARVCSPDDTCKGFSVSTTNACYTHLTCGVETSGNGCTDANADASYTHYVKTSAPALTCLNSGAWNAGTGRCDCVNVWCGETCERQARDCYDLYLYGYAPGAYTLADIYLNDTDGGAINVICYHDVNGGDHVKTYILINSYDGALTFNKTWAEYQAGFNRDIKQYWLGLDPLVRFASAGHTDLRMYVTASFGQYEIEYTNFNMMPENMGYQMTLQMSGFNHHSGPAFNLTDCLQTAQNTPFSTHDHQSVAGENCAIKADAGWWFPSGCDLSCNPLGHNVEQLPGEYTDQHVRVDNMTLAEFRKIEVYFYTAV